METEQATDGAGIEGALPAAVTENANDQQDAGTAQPSNGSRPAGYYPVPLEGLPDEVRKPVEERFKYLYSQVKTNERTLNEFRGIAASQSQKIEELMSGVGSVVDHLQSKNYEDVESTIRAQMEAAHANNDTKSFIELQDKLIEVKADKKAAEKERKAKPQQPQAKQYPTSTEMINGGVRNGEINNDDARVIDAWMNENDEVGNMLRPWAHTQNMQNDPKFAAAMAEAQAVFANPRFTTTEQRLAEVDRRMGLTRSNGNQTVMGGQLTNRPKNTKITLTPNQERIAVRTKFGGPKAKSDADHIAAYRAQIDKVNLAKGARK